MWFQTITIQEKAKASRVDLGDLGRKGRIQGRGNRGKDCNLDGISGFDSTVVILIQHLLIDHDAGMTQHLVVGFRWLEKGGHEIVRRRNCHSPRSDRSCEH